MKSAELKHPLRTGLPLAGILVLLGMLGPSACADPSTHIEKQFTVIVPVANMYSQPTEDSDVVSQALYGTNVTLIEEKPGWAYIRTPDEYPGWVPLTAVRRIRAGERPYASSGRVAQVESTLANLYREKDVTSYAPLLTVPYETQLEIISEAKSGERWLEVRLADGRTAYVQAGDVIFDPKPLSIEDAIALAKRFLGVTYTWGGRSSLGYDCSGFTQMLMRRRGVLMPRDADDQAAWTGLVPVKREKLKPGDLLYFGSSLEKITHTGMYIGNGEFIHDTTNTRPMVQISRLDDQPWTRLLVAGRRPK